MGRHVTRDSVPGVRRALAARVLCAAAVVLLAVPLLPPLQIPTAGAEQAGPLEITGDRELPSLVLGAGDTCIVSAANLTIRGRLSLSGDSSLLIRDSVVTVAPEDTPADVSPVSFAGNSTVAVQNSTLRFWAPPGPESVPYLISDDASAVSILGSTVEGESGSITPEARDLLKPAGCYMLTGNSVWVVRDSHIHGELNFSGPDGERVSWWYWCTLQSRAELELENVHGSLNDRLNALFKPISGKLRASNCTFEAQLLCEVISDIFLQNCTVDSESGVSLRDESSTVMVDTGVRGKLEIGVPSITTSVGTMRTSLELHGCTLEGPFYAMTNSTTVAERSDLRSVSLAGGSGIVLREGRVNGTVTVGERSRCTLEEAALSSPVVCRDNGTVALLNTLRNTPVVVYECVNASFSMENSSVSKLELSRGALEAALEGSYVDYACIWEGTSLDATLVNSSMTNLSSGECNITFTVHRSLIPARMDPATTYSVWTLYLVTATVNGEPADAAIEALEDGRVVAGSRCPDGACSFRLPAGEAGQPGGAYSVRAAYLGFCSTIPLESEEVSFSWTDTSGPEIGPPGTLADPGLAVNSEVPVRVRVEDREVRRIKSVVLHYSIGGKAWNSVRMVDVGDGYMADLPPASMGSRVEYYVTAEDALGNLSEGQRTSYVAGIAQLGALTAATIILIISAALAFSLQLLRRRKVRRYLGGGN